MSHLGGFSGQVILPLAHTFDPEEVSSCFPIKFKKPVLQCRFAKFLIA
jgi:hypothetical protein